MRFTYIYYWRVLKPTIKKIGTLDEKSDPFETQMVKRSPCCFQLSLLFVKIFLSSCPCCRFLHLLVTFPHPKAPLCSGHPLWKVIKIFTFTFFSVVGKCTMKYHHLHNCTHIFRNIKNLSIFSLWLVIPFLSDAVWKAKLAISTLLCNISLLWSPNTEIKLGRTASLEVYNFTQNNVHIFRTIKFPHFDFPKVSELWGILELVYGYYIHRVGGGGWQPLKVEIHQSIVSYGSSSKGNNNLKIHTCHLILRWCKCKLFQTWFKLLSKRGVAVDILEMPFTVWQIIKRIDSIYI